MAEWSDEQLKDLYLHYGPVVLRRAGAILGDEAEAEDVLQDVFRIVVQKISSFRGDSSVGTWLYQVTTRVCLDRLKSSRRRKGSSGEESGLSVPTSAGTGEAMTLLRELLRKIPEKLAVAATYYYVDGMTHEEIARVLGCSRRKVGYLLERFHARAARLVATDSEEHPKEAADADVAS